MGGGGGGGADKPAIPGQLIKFLCLSHHWIYIHEKCFFCCVNISVAL